MNVQFVAAAVGLIVKDHHVLMIKRDKEPFANLWSIPGGKIEKHEYVSDAVIREIEEEIGVSCNIDSYLGTISELVSNGDTLDRHHLIHVFQLSIVDGTPIDGSQWFSISTLDQENDITPSDVAIIQELLINKKNKYLNCHLRKEKGKYILESFVSPCKEYRRRGRS